MELVGLLFMATFLEGFITYIFGKKEEARPHLRYISLLLGVLITVAYEINIPELVGITSSMPFVDFVVSGLILGRGSNYINDIMSKFKG